MQLVVVLRSVRPSRVCDRVYRSYIIDGCAHLFWDLAWGLQNVEPNTSGACAVSSL